MKVLRLVLAIIVVSLSSYGLITDTFEVIIPYILLFLGTMLFVTGIIEFKKRKPTAITLMLASGFSFFVTIYNLIS